MPQLNTAWLHYMTGHLASPRRTLTLLPPETTIAVICPLERVRVRYGGGQCRPVMEIFREGGNVLHQRYIWAGVITILIVQILNCAWCEY